MRIRYVRPIDVFRPDHPSPTDRPPEGVRSFRVRFLTFIGVLAAIATLAACGQTDPADDASSTTSTETTTTTEATTTSSPTTSEDASTTTAPAGEGLGETERCSNPEGFSISYPADWAVNDGSVTEACSLFDPEPFDVPEATDARVAAISAYVDDIPFSEVAAPDSGSELMRAVTAVDGHQAVRLSGATVDDGLHPPGTPVTRYLIDLALGVDDGPGTLFVDVIGVGDVDFDGATRVLDLMVRTIDIEGDAVDDAEGAVVARYGGGGTPFAVLAQRNPAADGVCLRLDTVDATSCVADNGATADGLRTIRLGDGLQPILAGTAGADVFRIEARQTDGSVSSYLPVTVGDTDTDTGTPSGVRGWAFPFGREAVTELTWYDLDGQELGRRTTDQGGSDEGPAAIGDFDYAPIVSGDFPGDGEPAFLTDVRIGAHDGFDRVVFQLTGGGSDLTYRIEFVDEPIRQPSGQPMDLPGESFLNVTMTPASRVDLSGAEPDLYYDGPDSITTSAGATVRGIGLAEDFESTLTWAVGVDNGARIAAAVLDDPKRLVIDIAPAER